MEDEDKSVRGVPESAASHPSDDEHFEYEDQRAVVAAMEKEMTRYYRLSQALHDAINASGDAGLIKSAEDAIKDIFPEAT